MAGLHSCQRTLIWPVVFAFLIAKMHRNERSQVDCHTHKQAEFVGMTIYKEKKKTKKPKFLQCQVPLTAIPICSPVQAPNLLQSMAAASGVLKGFHAENWLWLCLRTLPYLGKVSQVVLHHLAEGCTEMPEKFLPEGSHFSAFCVSLPLKDREF